MVNQLFLWHPMAKNRLRFQDFWHWRFQQLAAGGGDLRDAPPPGMQWEWGAQSDANDTDW